jgi:hypothetical protein
MLTADAITEPARYSITDSVTHEFNARAVTGMVPVL